MRRGVASASIEASDASAEHEGLVRFDNELKSVLYPLLARSTGFTSAALASMRRAQPGRILVGLDYATVLRITAE